MTKSKKGLGRGLSALISSKPAPVSPYGSSSAAEKLEAPEARSADTAPPSIASERVRYINLTAVHANPHQPRQSFNDAEIDELAQSIKTHGVLQPVLVRPSQSHDGHFEIVAGERRFRAAQKASLSQLPVLIRDFSDLAALEIAIVENVQRSDLSAMEEARAYQRLIDEFTLSQREVAEKVGKERATVANFLRLLKLPEGVQQLLEEGKISVGHAKAILTVKEPAAQINLANKVIEDGLTVRDLERIVSRSVQLDGPTKPERARGEESKKRAPEYPELEDRLRRSLGTKVSVRSSSDGAGKIELSYYSEEELDRLVDKLAS